MGMDSTLWRRSVRVNALLLAVGLFAVPTAAQTAGRVALVVGNSTYAHIGRLPNPGNDAADMAAALRRLGFEVTTTLDADRGELNDSLRAFTRQSAGADVSLVFYAGHGIEMDGVNYLVPVDARLERDVDVRFEAVALDDVLVSTTGALLRLVILDACRNNPLARSMQRTGASRSVSRGSFGDLDESLLGNETLVAYAAAGGTTAADGTGRNSPYTSALLAYLEEPVELLTLFRRVRAQVLATTNGDQRPHEYQSLLGEHYLGGAPAPGNVPVRDPRLIEAAVGLDREARRRVQQGLAAAGFSPGPADGVFGAGTRAAIRRWQASRGAAVSGYLDGAGAQALGAPVAASAQTVTVTAGPPATAVPAAVQAGADATPGAVRAQQENLFWQSIMASENPADFEAYLRQFPDGVYADLARNRVADLSPAAEPAASAAPSADRPRSRAPGTVFRECATCPELVVVPAGRFRMGCVSGRDCQDDEHPVHEVELTSFALGVYEVTFEEYDRFVQATGHRRPGDGGWGRGGRPVIDVSWEDAERMWRGCRARRASRIGCRASRSGSMRRVRARRRATVGARMSGATGRTAAGCGSRWDADRTAPAGSFAANGWGLHDMHGNVWEWVADCWHENYARAPRDGTAWTSGGNCGRRVLRGGSWFNRPVTCVRRIAAASMPARATAAFGFRVSRTLD